MTYLEAFAPEATATAAAEQCSPTRGWSGPVKSAARSTAIRYAVSRTVPEFASTKQSEL
jgi:hypothetical protein